MIIELLDPFFERYATDKVVLAALATLRVEESEILLPDEEFRAYVERPADGYAIEFTDENYLFDRDEPIGSTGRLLVTGLFIYVEAIDNYEPFVGDLPFAIAKTDLSFDIARKLGAPEASRKRDDGSVRLQSWIVRPNRKLSITYSEAGTPSVLSYHAIRGEA